MAKLYELTQDYNSIFELVIDDDADLDCLEDTLQAIEGEIEIKTENIGKLIQMIQFDAGRLEDESARLKKMAAALDNKVAARNNHITRIKNYLRGLMELLGKDKIKTSLFTVWLQESKSVDDFAPNLIPAEYLKPSNPVIDRAAILKDLKSGKEVPGCALQTRVGVRIR